MTISVDHVVHINLNAADIDRASAFYNGLGLEPGSHMHAPPQDGAGMGLAGEAQWNGYAMQDHRGWDCPMVDLLQWLRPETAGSPPRSARAPGFNALALRAAGVDCPYPPCWLDMGPDIPIEGLWALFFRDPDGCCVELIQHPEF